MKITTASEFENHLLNNGSIIDVRSPVEFLSGSIPGSVNLPVLNDLERHQVGLCYKQMGQEAAVRLGYEIVSKSNLEEKRTLWINHLKRHPESILTCFRGGLRSQSTQKFILETGLQVPRLQLGYKFARTYFIETITKAAVSQNFLILTGNTGSGKTHLLNQIRSFYPVIDLEGLAHHRGSAFGAWDIEQPTQINFENQLAVEILKLSPKDRDRYVLLEDESRMIGHRHIPEGFFTKMRESQVIVLNEPLENRIENIYFDYITSKLQDMKSTDKISSVLGAYKNSVNKIKTKLGGLRAQELLQDLAACEADYLENFGLDKNKIWIEKLLVWYYDPMYTGSLHKRNPVICHQGSKAEIKAYFQSLI